MRCGGPASKEPRKRICPCACLFCLCACRGFAWTGCCTWTATSCLELIRKAVAEVMASRVSSVLFCMWTFDGSKRLKRKEPGRTQLPQILYLPLRHSHAPGRGHYSMTIRHAAFRSVSWSDVAPAVAVRVLHESSSLRFLILDQVRCQTDAKTRKSRAGCSRCPKAAQLSNCFARPDALRPVELNYLSFVSMSGRSDAQRLLSRS